MTEKKLQNLHLSMIYAEGTLKYLTVSPNSITHQVDKPSVYRFICLFFWETGKEKLLYIDFILFAVWENNVF